MNEITFEYVENTDGPTDTIYIFIDHGLLQEWVEVEVDHQYYRLFNYKNDCMGHYKTHKEFEDNIKNYIKRVYNLK